MFPSRKCSNQSAKTIIGDSFNEAAMFPSRKFLRVWCDGPVFIGFNEAAMFPSRKYYREIDLKRYSLASMRPRCFHRGNAGRESEAMRDARLQ